MSAALDAQALTVSYGGLPALIDIDLTIGAGESLGLVGESGCGKSTFAFAATRHLAGDGAITGGRLEICGQNIAALDAEGLRRLRGAGVAMVYQDPVGALNPVMRIGRQLEEALTAHRAPNARTEREEIHEVLSRVRLPDPEAILNRYTHQLSGGQIQRVVIAMALLARPRLLVLDEPTTGLDVTVEAGVLDLVTEIAAAEGMALLYISHDIGVIARVCTRTAVMYAGRIVEEGPTDQVLTDPRHPYTRALLTCRPGSGRRMQSIPGRPPPPDALPPGCSFAPRCAFAEAGLCDRTPAPEMVQQGPDRAARCRRLDAVANAGEDLAEVEKDLRSDAPDDSPVVLKLSGIGKTFGERGLLARLTGRVRRPVTAAREVGFELQRGHLTALVGESGSGKSTLARILVGLHTADAGHAEWREQDAPTDIAHLPAGRRSRSLIRAIQIVFQNPDSTLNPAHRIDRILGRAARRLAPTDRRPSVSDLLSMVRLPPEMARRWPGDLSGGQRQRIAIARAFAGQPGLVIADEPVSALDVSVQAAIVDLLSEMRTRSGTAILFISHDLLLVREVADEVVVLYRGEVMEQGTVTEVFARPSHPYTESLLSTVHPPLPGYDLPPPAVLDRAPSPDGCPFAPRCHRYIGPVCDETRPHRRRVGSKGGHAIACHHDATTLSRPFEKEPANAP